MNLPLELLTEITNYIGFESDILSFISVNLLHTKIPKIYTKECSYTYLDEFIYRMIYPKYISISKTDLNKYEISTYEHSEDDYPSLVTNLENIVKKNYNKYSKICANNLEVLQDMIDNKIFDYEHLELRNFKSNFSLYNNLSIKRLSLHEMSDITIHISCKNLEYLETGSSCNNLKLIFDICDNRSFEINMSYKQCPILTILGLEKHKYITVRVSVHKSLFMYFDSIYNLYDVEYEKFTDKNFEIKNGKLFSKNRHNKLQEIKKISFNSLFYDDIKKLRDNNINF